MSSDPQASDSRSIAADVDRPRTASEHSVMESEDADAQERLGMLSLDSTMSQSQDLHILPLADTTTDSPPETNSATGTSASASGSATNSSSFVADTELRLLLEQADLGAYINVFEENQVDCEAFLLLRESHLRALNIPMGPRLKLLALIRRTVDPTHRAMANGVTAMPMVDFDELQFLECIGRGSFGAVFKGSWNGRIVAIKKLLSACDEEASLNSKIRHRNVVQVFGACFDPPNFCLIMEYAQCNLKQAIHDRNIEATVVVDWAMQIATGMNYLHTEAPVCVIHRDLKPSNVLVFSDGALKISDFGLSRTRDETMTDRMSAVGTFEYMAPEVIKNEPYNEKADVYSFGVLVWEILTRQTPYSGIPSLAVAFGVGSGTLSLPIPSSCPPLFATLLQRCWERDHHDRPSFKDVLRVLEGIAASDFMNVNYVEMARMRQGWTQELGSAFDRFNREYDALKQREAQLSRVEMSLSEREYRLVQREAEVLSLISSDLTCWATLKRYTDDTLGLGLNISRGGQSGASPFQVTRLEVCFDYLSATAFFDHRVRHSIRRDMTLNYWMPMYICEAHGKRAAGMMEEAIYAITTATEQRKVPPVTWPSTPTAHRSERASERRFVPGMAVAVLGMLMNNMVVSAMKETIHPFKALEGYCAFHRILLHFAEVYPELLVSCQKKVGGFLLSDERRHRNRVLNLGEFLILLSLVEVHWGAFLSVFIPEMLQRCWPTILAACPELRRMTVDEQTRVAYFHRVTSDEELLAKASKGSRAHFETIMVHLYFLRHVVRTPSPSSLRAMAHDYDVLLGQPRPSTKQRFERSLRDIAAVSSLAGMLEYIEYPGASTMSREDVANMMRRAAAEATIKGYIKKTSVSE